MADVYNAVYTVFMEICRPLKVYVFSEQGHHTPIKIGTTWSNITRWLCVASSEFWIQKSFMADGWDGPPSQTTPSSTWLLSWFSQGPPKMPAATGNRKQSRQNNAHISRRLVMHVCYHFWGVGYKLLSVLLTEKAEKWVRFKDLFLKEKDGVL